MKLLPLTVANIKGFIRNWKSVVLLLLLPILLVTIVFLSFNPKGMSVIPVGLVGELPGYAIEDLENGYFSYLDISEYSELDACLRDLYAYGQYICMSVEGEGLITVLMYYDNTREPIIWEVIERIKTTVSLLQKERSREVADGLFTTFDDVKANLDTFERNLDATTNQLNIHIIDARNSKNILTDARRDLTSALYTMNEDIDSVKSHSSNLRFFLDDTYGDINNDLDTARSYLQSINNVSGIDSAYLYNAITLIDNADDELYRYEREASSSLAVVDGAVSDYEQSSQTGITYLGEINQGISKVTSVEQELQGYQSDLNNVGDELNSVKSSLNAVDGVDAELLIAPIKVDGIPAYVPFVEGSLAENASSQDIVEGFNLIGLQTIFPNILLLIVLFLSLLMSSFMCLSSINSSSYLRIRLVRGSFFPQLFSVYISTFILLLLPILSTLWLGNYLFKLPLLENALLVSLLLFLLTTIFILFGMFFAYLIKKESIALLVTTFLLVFFIFFSGFLLPAERMSLWSGFLSSIFPPQLALSAFSMIVFYGEGISTVSFELQLLTAWAVGLFALVCFTKKMRS